MMTALSLIFNLLGVPCIFLYSFSQGVKIQFFKYENFTGLVLESNSSKECVKFPYNKSSEVSSVKMDTCFIAYSSPFCKPAVSKKFLPGVVHGPHVSVIETFHYIGSFHTCNEKEGSNQLNLDITERPFFMNFNPVVLQSYKNLCFCVNVPQYVQNMSYWSIDNHHNDLLAYYEEDCSEKKWNAKFIVAGHNWDTRAMYVHNKTDNVTNKMYKIKSFGPNPNSTYFQTSCQMSSKITTKSPKTLKRTTENSIDINADVNKRFEVMTKQFMELQTKQKEDFEKLFQMNIQLQQQVGNISAQIKSELRQLFS